MKKKLTLILFMVSLLSFSGLECKLDDKDKITYSKDLSYLKIKNEKIYKSYLLVRDDGEVLIEDNSDEALPLASLTKIMTAMVVLDNIKDLNEEITINKEEANIPYGVRLKEGKKYKVIDLMYFMLMMSSNSSAQALANSVSNNFIGLMNKKAQEIGANSASYCSANGLPPSYTHSCLDIASAKDVYKISKYALENYPLIAKITSTKYKTINNINLINSNELLRTNKYIKGIKTGYHKIAGYNISILYDNNKNRLYEIILGSDTENNRKLISKEVLKQFDTPKGE